MSFRTALFAGAAFTVVIFVFGIPGLPEAPYHPEQVECFKVKHYVGEVPAVHSELVENTDTESEIKKYQRRIESSVSSATEAVGNCSAESCTQDAELSMRKAVKWYVATRRIMTTNIFREKGDEAASLTNEIFGTEAESTLSENLRSLYRSGKLDLAKFKDEREATALFVLKPNSSFQPCPEAAK